MHLTVIVEVKMMKSWFCWQVNLNSMAHLKALNLTVKMYDNWVDPPRGH